MMGSKSTKVGENWSGLLAPMCEAMAQEQDYVRARNLRQLVEKSETGLLHVAFCGHFSAGKSTLINRLCGHKLLPSSPIPASANVVTIKAGEAGAWANKSTAEGVPFLEEIPLQDLEAYCLRGEEFQSLRLQYPIPLLSEHGLAFLDTPGIDSSDDNHQAATASALHLADVVFYVMDYNHVQSEINFDFAKHLQQMGKPLYFIVNMIDKHNEQELPFTIFCSNVRQSFEDWDIRPSGILYLSLLDTTHPYNEWERLLWLLQQLGKQGESIQRTGLLRAGEVAVQDHMKWLQASHEEEKEQLQASVTSPEAAARREEVRTKLSAQQGETLARVATAREEARKIIDNANVMPAVTREKAEVFLESRKRGFKAGFFAGAKKNEQEKEQRLHAFYEDLKAQDEAHLQWHLQDLARKLLDNSNLEQVDMEALRESIVHIQGGWEKTWLIDSIHPGATLDREYTLPYSRHIVAELQKKYRQIFNDWIDDWSKRLTEQDARQAITLQTELSELDRACEAQDALDQITAVEQAHQTQLMTILHAVSLPPLVMPDLADAPELPGNREPLTDTTNVQPIRAKAVVTAEKTEDRSNKMAETTSQSSETGQGAQTADFTLQLQASAERLEQAGALLADVPAAGALTQALLSKAERLRTSRFTVALFGAFSAGKSSLVNALLRDKVLPVSPQPTTAAINQIVPPHDGRVHKTAVVKLKSLETLSEEFVYAFELLGLKFRNMDQAMGEIQKLRPSHLEGTAKAHYAFMKAAANGWSEMKGKLGQEIEVDGETFRSYAAEESLSCFVESIELVYDSPLSRQGIVFVDTPGADSVNARHTGISFNYIKNADAVLFVTYYNHAFSRADREFLLQLGRVKESFEMDKMFFLVNAADLASSSEELDQVVQYVESNLTRFEIRQPRLYPVSSLLAQKAYDSGDDQLFIDSGVAAFERDFLAFMEKERVELALRSAESEIGRALTLIQGRIEEAQRRSQDEQRYLQETRERAEQVEQLIRSGADEQLAELLEKEIRELLYYVKQRVSFRFGEWYNLSFNPSSFAKPDADVKTVLWQSWRELLSLLSYSSSQEMLAVTLKIENTLDGLFTRMMEEQELKSNALLPGCPLPSWEKGGYQTPQVAESLEMEDVEVRFLNKMYRNGRSFFEEGGKAVLRVELEKRLADSIARYMEEHTISFVSHYRKMWAFKVEQQQQRQLEQLEEYVAGLQASDGQDLQQYANKAAQLRKLVAESAVRS